MSNLIGNHIVGFPMRWLKIYFSNLYRHGPDTSFGNPFSKEDISFTDAVLYITKELRPLVKKSQTFLPTLATCVGTVKKKILVLELKPGIHVMNEEKTPRKRLSKS